MKIGMYSLVLFLSFSSICFSQEDVEKYSPPTGDALVGDFYGSDISNAKLNKAVSVDVLERNLQTEYRLENVVVKGEITGVCPKRGCWVSVKTENGLSFFVKMKDYAFFVPTTLKGKNVVLEGSAERKVTSVDELRHYAKDGKKSKLEIEAIKYPKEEIRFMARGIKVVD